MKFTTLFAPLALLAPTFASPIINASASADSPTIVDALTSVNQTTVKFGNVIVNWNGGLLGTVPVLAESTALLVTVKKGTSIAEHSEPLDNDGALAVAGTTQSLVASVNTTLTTLIEARPKFDKLLLTPIIVLNLKIQRDATADLSEAIIAKVPEALQAIAKNLVAPIDQSFATAIDAYEA
ncbi:hydrophobic surface binding protein A-domain-containing protein [Dichotomopilus funicola]|uniref:Hydrophobic surface binding protein A-domain-containing protein n=1 Tax=Dichotomopilus funicola TaxID=1934379 RepID=A0AAN6V720_9PEZI|nr:hydrophobic surface binding protein A-domain-containing protein [Dichotomopilus funicola]